MAQDLKWLDQPDQLNEKLAFKYWQDETDYHKAYYVAPDGCDDGEGSLEQPFQTVKRASEVVRPGEKVVLRGGEYAQTIRPLRGGTGKDAMIAYEAYPGEKVVVTGLRTYTGVYTDSPLWKSLKGKSNVFRLSVVDFVEDYYNPFALNMMPHDWIYLGESTIQRMIPFLLPRGRVVVDGEMLPQAQDMNQLSRMEKGVWAEATGRFINIIWPDATLPQHDVKLMMAETLFNPAETGMGYIAVRGIHFHGCANGYPVPQNGAFSANRGHHFIVENCDFSRVNGIALEVGQQCWNSARIITDGHIVRRNHFTEIGVCAVACFGADDMLLENNEIHDLCYAPIEFLAESAAIKLHWANRCLLRGNRIYNTVHGQGIWLDYTNVDCRVTGNTVFNCCSSNGGIMFEANRAPCVLDNNLVMQIVNNTMEDELGGFGVMCFGSDFTRIYRNFFFNCAGAALFINEVKTRVCAGRGGLGRKNKVYENIFAGKGRALIEIPSEDNEFDDNLYAPAMGGYIRIGTHDVPYSKENVNMPNLRLDLEAFQTFFQKELAGQLSQLSASLDAARAELEIRCEEASLPQLLAITLLRGAEVQKQGGQCLLRIKV